MKPILGVAVLLSWFARCEGIDLPRGQQHGHGSHHSDAGAEQDPDAALELDAASPEIDAGELAEVDAAVAPESKPCDGPPGLYVEHSCERLADGVRPYRPLYELWSDGALKERFIYLPPDTQIDVAYPDRWTFPVGTRLYKTFHVDDLRTETRVIEKIKPEPGVDSWTFTAYQWSADQSSVSVADAAGVSNVLGTAHDIPSQAQCKSCHTMTTSATTKTTDALTGAVTTAALTKNLDAVNGFQAIQLNHPQAGVTLSELSTHGLFFNSAGGPSVDLDAARIPGDAKAQAALGYLHANCAHCHGGAAPRAGLNLTAKVGMTLTDAPAVKTGMCACLSRWTGRSNPEGEPYKRRIVSGHPSISGIAGRMSVRGMGEQMPPLGTEIVDPTGLASVSDWIASLDPTACDALAECVVPPPAMPPAPAAPPVMGSASPAPQ
jgi:hypothetical protein